MNALDKLGLAIANAGITWTPEMRTAYEQGVKDFEQQFKYSASEVEAAVLAEREACAKVCEDYFEFADMSVFDDAIGFAATNAIAAAIRARGDK